MKRFAMCLVLSTFCVVAAAQEPADERPKLGSEAVLEKSAARYLNIFSDGAASDYLLSANPLGIEVAEPDAALRAQLALGESEGLVVTSVPSDTAGAKAGLQVHDILLQVGSEKVGTPADLTARLEKSDGQAVKLRVRRAGKDLTLEAVPVKPQFARVALSQYLLADAAVTAAGDSYRIGVALSEADGTLRQQLRLAAGEGLVVTEVFPDTPAASAGIQVHDVLTVLDGKRLTTVEAANSQIQEIADRSVELRLLRGGREVTLTIAPKKTPQAAFIDRPLTVWQTRACTGCHADPHAGMAHNLGANQSVWLDGNRARIYLHDLVHDYSKSVDLHLNTATAATSPQTEIAALKVQLGQMQATLAKLEASLQAKTAETDASKPEDAEGKK